jgi:lysozyme family protein
MGRGVAESRGETQNVQDVRNVGTRRTQLAQRTDVPNFTMGGVVYLKAAVLTFR